MEPKISVIIPIYNTGEFSRACLTSVVGQSYKNLEILCVNDGSTDALTLEILSEFAEKDSRIIVINKTNEGLPLARKTGIESATGEYVIHLDGDDYWELDCVETLYKRLSETGADSCVMNFTFDYPDGTIRVNQYDFKPEYGTGKEFFFEQYLNNSVCCMWQSLHKKSLYSTRTIFEQKAVIGEDFLTNLSLYWFATKVVVVNRPLYHYIQRGTSIIYSCDNHKVAECTKIVIQKSIEFIDNNLNRQQDIKYKEKAILCLTSQYILFGGNVGLKKLCTEAQNIVDSNPDYKSLRNYRHFRKVIKLYTIFSSLGELYRRYYILKGKIKK